MIRSEEITASQDEPTLADIAMHLVLQLLFWLAMYGLGLFLVLYADPGYTQAAGLLGTALCVERCVRYGIQLYRVNKTMRNINK